MGEITRPSHTPVHEELTPPLKPKDATPVIERGAHQSPQMRGRAGGQVSMLETEIADLEAKRDALKLEVGMLEQKKADQLAGPGGVNNG